MLPYIAAPWILWDRDDDYGDGDGDDDDDDDDDDQPIGVEWNCVFSPRFSDKAMWKMTKGYWIVDGTRVSSAFLDTIFGEWWWSRGGDLELQHEQGLNKWH